MGGPLGAVDGYYGVRHCFSTCWTMRGTLTLSVIAVGAVLAPIPILAITVLLSVTLPLAACCC
jgi:hypothetical protein